VATTTSPPWPQTLGQTLGAGQHGLRLREIVGAGAKGQQGHRKTDARCQVQQGTRDRRIADQHQGGGRQHRIDEELERAAGMAGHAELQHVVELHLAALGLGRDADLPRLPVTQRAAYRLDHGRLGAAAADPAVDAAFGADHSFVTRLGRSGSHRLEHGHQGKGLTTLAQSARFGHPEVMVHGRVFQCRWCCAARRSARPASGRQLSMQPRARVKAMACGAERVG